MSDEGCIKCGFGKLGIVALYVAKGDRVAGVLPSLKVKSHDEHLVHRCTNCSYSWTTPTLDQIRDGKYLRESTPTEEPTA